MWHPNERKFFYFINKFFYFTFLMVISMSVIYFILLGNSFILIGNSFILLGNSFFFAFIWILCILVWYYGIEDHWVKFYYPNKMMMKSGLEFFFEILPCTLRNCKCIFYFIERMIIAKVTNSVTKITNLAHGGI